jgi:peptidoglycan lytic transglycosylase
VSRSRIVLLAFCSCVSLVSVGCASRRTVSAAPPTQPAPNPAGETAKAPSPAPRPKTPAAPPAAGYTEEGNASWYGKPFNGRRASDGEVYDMYKLTAAHRTLPFDTMVRVTNLNNGKTTTVRIIDRGPFVDNRIIDLSLAAAREIESVGPGVVPVRLEVLGDVDVTAGFFTVQVGAFRERANAERLRARLSLTYTPIFIQQYDSSEGTFYRLRVGKISGEDAANDLAAQLRSREGFTTLVFRLDETKSAGAN